MMDYNNITNELALITNGIGYIYSLYNSGKIKEVKHKFSIFPLRGGDETENLFCFFEYNYFCGIIKDNLKYRNSFIKIYKFINDKVEFFELEDYIPYQQNFYFNSNSGMLLLNPRRNHPQIIKIN